jgi:chromosome segregation ATPase
MQSFKDLGQSLREVIEKEKEKARKIQEAMQRDREEQERMQRRIDELQRLLEEADKTPAADADAPELRKRVKQLEDEKAALEVRMMILLKKEQSRAEEVARKDRELKVAKDKAAELEKERLRMAQRFAEAEEQDRLNQQKYRDTLDRINREVQRLSQEVSSKRSENSTLLAELENLRSLLRDLETARAAEAKYKEMGKKMLQAMKVMDAEMKGVVAKYEEAATELKAVHKEKRKLERQNEELKREAELVEKQMNKLMRIAITGAVSD